MEKIICFGDSNTFGFNPKNGSRYGSDTRWTSLLSKILGDEFEVIEEGMNNRTGFFKNPDGHLQSGANYLPECLEKHTYFETFILALGTNDLQKFFNIDKRIVQEGLKNLVTIIRKVNPDGRIILIPPVLLCDDVLNSHFCCQFNEESIDASRWIQEIYENFAQQESCEFFDLNKIVAPSNLDGLHFEKESHRIIAEQIAGLILNGEGNNIKSKLIKNH